MSEFSEYLTKMGHPVPVEELGEPSPATTPIPPPPKRNRMSQKPLQVHYKLTSAFAQPPTRMHKSDAGFDLIATKIISIDEGGRGFVEYGTGLHLEIPEGYVGLIFPRSSISDHGMSLANSVGVIDSGYRGEVKFRFYVTPGAALYQPGDRVGQLLILPIPSVEFVGANDLEESDRGDIG